MEKFEEFKKRQIKNALYCLEDDDMDIEAAINSLKRYYACQENSGYAINRLKHDKGDLENSLHKKWIEINLPEPCVNNGHGILQDIMTQHDIEVTDRERKIVATMIQWIGTNVGMCFLQEALKDANYTMKYNG